MYLILVHLNEVLHNRGVSNVELSNAGVVKRRSLKHWSVQTQELVKLWNVQNPEFEHSDVCHIIYNTKIIKKFENYKYFL